MTGGGTPFLSDLENGKETIELGKALVVLAALGIDLKAEVRGSGP
jgi:HTH-type transcriptional regulator / antitoxin HipB